ncbi:LTA synthase family protein [Listeria fleischmannii]|uniref:LTA synthase family protein n=1 Tax=Listeria fleischmannii TaxID=1069827 RepID=A0A841YDW1_9LIST|nr:LTA synthase family protein [Listeria fleischmannii]MBC1398404.1 LTA synthase family protein [Listeria fleischmannii]MBC1426465.1 LTA synthase family protein [Listeria fleischmannii]STY35737.1 Lipoteichoic acid synthase 1 [Listeria fleischmannii subsp. coloradonensis]
MLIIYLILIVGQFALAYFQVFQDPNILSFIADLSFVIVLLLLIHTFVKPRAQVYVYAGLTLFLGILMLVFVLYGRFYNEIPTYHSLSLIGEVGVVKDSATSLLKWYDWLFFASILLLPVVLYLDFKKGVRFKTFSIKRGPFGIAILSLVLLIGIFTYDMMSKNIISDTKRAERMGVFTFNLATAFTGTTNVRAADITADNIREIKGVTLKENPKYFGAAKGKNLIIIQLESFQRNLTGVKLNGQSVTPTLDKLENETFYSDSFFQTVSKSNTADAEWSVYTSTFPSGYYTNTQTYGDRVIPSLPRTLSGKGYETATFHTNDASFYNRDNFYPAVGFNKFYDRSFFGDDDVIGFSPSDEVLYNKTLPILEEHYKNDEKFYAQLISVSSHMPFKIPESKQSLTLPENLNGTELGNYFQAMHYADKQLGAFIQKLKKSGIWDDSVVVMYGDHHIIDTTKLPDEQKTYVNRSSELKAQPADDYRIPFYLHIPGVNESGKINNIGGEIDIMPTVLNLLGIKATNQIMFGEDILNTQTNFVPERYTMPEGSYLANDYMYMPDESFETGKATYYDGQNKELSSDVKKRFEASRKLLQYSDSYVDNLPKQKDVEK